MQVESEFLDEDPHAPLGCITCHGGQSGDLTKEAAHTDMTRDPSLGPAPSCNGTGCHPSISADHALGLHGTQNGYLTMIERRIGGSLPQQAYDMFDARCASCHTSCGQCHISRPTSVKGGLIDGHVFNARPSQTNNCIGCHGSRIGEEFRGRNEGIPPDVHYLNSIRCVDCHSQIEIHGDGTTPPTRYESPNAPNCQDAGCHAELGSGNGQHATHVDSDLVACQVCHSVSYKNCYSCHVQLDEQGLEFPSRMDFRIGRNPDVTADRPWAYVVLRHIPITPDTFTDWGLSLPAYTDEPTWRYATPHNIRRSTPQNSSCTNCHTNDGIFLTPAYVDSLIQEGIMVPEEVQANAPVVTGAPDF